MKKTLGSILLTVLLVVPALAQTANEPPIPPQLATNLVTGVGLVDFVLNIWPSIDTSLTNSFGSGEFNLKIGPAWKSLTATGFTPFMSVAPDYFFSRHFGVGAQIITFGDGTGTSTVDSAYVSFLARADRGNVAGYAILGAGREFNGLNTGDTKEGGRFEGRIGIGVEYRYKTKIGLSLDHSLLIWGKESDENGWLTDLQLSYHF